MTINEERSRSISNQNNQQSSRSADRKENTPANTDFKMFVRQQDQHNKDKTNIKNPFKTYQKRDEDIARRKQLLRDRNNYNANKSVQNKKQADKTLPKHLNHVESKIKNRVAIDKEISKVRKERGYYKEANKDTEIYVSSPPPGYF